MWLLFFFLLGGTQVPFAGMIAAPDGAVRGDELRVCQPDLASADIPNPVTIRRPADTFRPFLAATIPLGPNGRHLQTRPEQGLARSPINLSERDHRHFYPETGRQLSGERGRLAWGS